MSLENPNLPYVGQLVDFYPNNTTRFAALVIEVHETEDISERPLVNLKVFKPDGEMETWEEVEPVQMQVEDDTELKEKWGFQHEFLLQVNETEPTMLGTNSNNHVGDIGLN